MSELWAVLLPFITVSFGYIGLFVTIGVVRPRVCIRICEMFNAIIVYVLVFTAGAGIALTWARNYITDPAHHRHFWGPEIGPTPEESQGNRRILFAHDAMAGEQGVLVAAGLCVALWWVVNLALIALCRHIIADHALDVTKPPACTQHCHTEADTGDKHAVS